MYNIADFQFDHALADLEGPLELFAVIVEFIFY
jgi:hypothetical protein